MKKFKKGDRVRDAYLGDGTFIKYVSGLCLVQWDKTPSIKYNMGENPSLSHCSADLDKIDGED